MKNLFKVFGNLNRARSAKVPLLIIAIVAVIGFSFVACKEDVDDDKGDTTTSGRLTITGLSSYNGWKIIHMGDGIGNLELTAENNNDGWATVNISSSSVTIYVWKGGKTPSNWKSYNGNDQNVVFNITISKGNSIDYANGTVTVNFTNGVGTGAFVSVP